MRGISIFAGFGEALDINSKTLCGNITGPVNSGAWEGRTCNTPILSCSILITKGLYRGKREALQLCEVIVRGTGLYSEYVYICIFAFFFQNS